MTYPTTHNSTDFSLSFNEALELLDKHPALQKMRKAANHLEEAHQSSPFLDQNPIIAIGLGPRVEPKEERNWEANWSLTQAISLEGATRLRKKVLQAEMDWFKQDVALDVYERRIRVSRAWLDLKLIEIEERVLYHLSELEKEQFDYLTQMETTGESSKLLVQLQKSKWLETKRKYLESQRTRLEAASALLKELPIKTISSLNTQGDWPSFTASATSTFPLAQDFPESKRAQWIARAEHIRSSEESAQKGTRLTLGGQGYRDALGANVVMGFVQLPIPIWDAGHRERAIRTAESLQSEARYHDAVQNAEATLVYLREELVRAQNEVDLLKEQHALTQKTLQDQQLLWTKKIVSWFELADAKRIEWILSLDYAHAQRHLAWAKIRAKALEFSK